MQLVKITSPTADVAGKYNPHPEAKALLQPSMTPTQYSGALQQGSFSQDHINFLAHGMPEHESVGWACQSSAKVADKLEPADKNALAAAQQWVKNPTPANQSAAAAAAGKTNYQGPGAWAAQGAAWAKTPGAPATTAAAPGLTGHAVAGSVMLAAAKTKMPAMPAAPSAPTAPTLQAPTIAAPKVPTLQKPAAPAPPSAPPMPLKQRIEMAKIHQPFIDLGQGIASGQKPFI